MHTIRTEKKRTLQFCTGGNVNRTEVCNNAFAASNSKRFFVLVPAALPQAVLKFLLGLTPPHCSGWIGSI